MVASTRSRRIIAYSSFSVPRVSHRTIGGGRVSAFFADSHPAVVLRVSCAVQQPKIQGGLCGELNTSPLIQYPDSPLDACSHLLQESAPVKHTHADRSMVNLPTVLYWRRPKQLKAPSDGQQITTRTITLCTLVLLLIVSYIRHTLSCLNWRARCRLGHTIRFCGRHGCC